MNNIILTGRLVRDPELNTTNSGTEVCNFTVAVDRRVKKDQEKITDYIDCTAWAKSGVFVSKYFHKGDGISVQGRMESRKWVDNDGKNRVSWGVTVENVEFALGKKQGDTATVYNSAEEVDYTEVPDEEFPF